jgi:hypothetical protein
VGRAVKKWLKQTASRAWVYLYHIAALFFLSRQRAVHSSDSNEPGTLQNWSDDDLRLLVDEGRRQVDRQTNDLERIRLRAQVLLALGIALEGTAGSFQSEVSKADSCWVWALWILALLLIGFSILGAAATAATRADLEIIHATALSRYEPNALRHLADDYAAIMPGNESQIATRLINMRLAIILVLVGGLCALLTWFAADSLATTPVHAHFGAGWRFGP